MNKGNTNEPRTRNALWTRFHVALAIATTLLVPNVRAEEAKAIPDTLVVTVEDTLSRATVNPDIQRNREDMLQSAFTSAAEQADWISDVEINYNAPDKSGQEPKLSVNIVDWNRTPAGTFECTLNSAYKNPDGENVNLGISDATQSGINVVTEFDIEDNFRKTARSAFSETLEKLREKINASS